MMDEMIEMGSIIGDIEGGLWRVLEVTNAGIFLLMLPERHSVIHTRSVSWEQYDQSYELKFP